MFLIFSKLRLLVNVNDLGTKELVSKLNFRQTKNRVGCFVQRLMVLFICLNLLRQFIINSYSVIYFGLTSILLQDRKLEVYRLKKSDSNDCKILQSSM